MIAALRAELRKLLTVRSTYILSLATVLFILLFAGLIDGYKASGELLNNPNYLAMEVTNALTLAAVFCGLIAILLFSHEYRYNTIMHTLTSVNNRGKVLLAKVLVMTVFAALFALVMGTLSPVAAHIGSQLAGHDAVAQTIPVRDLLWRGAFLVWGYVMIGLLLVALSRNQVFSVVALLFIPSTLEGIIGVLLKENAVYQPFAALNAVASGGASISPEKAALVFLAYMAAWWTTAWVLFMRRDATNNRS